MTTIKLQLRTKFNNPLCSIPEWSRLVKDRKNKYLDQIWDLKDGDENLWSTIQTYYDSLEDAILFFKTT